MHAGTSYRVCPLCEATCGLEIRTHGREVVGIRGDDDDVFSRGFICPKAYALKELDADPDRLRTPLVRRNGTLEPATWDEAFTEIERRLGAVIRQRGRDAGAGYLGHPSVHRLALRLYGAVFVRALGTKNAFSARTVGVERTEALARPFGPEVVARRCGIDAATIRRLARELATTERAAVYGRIGTCTQEFGTLASWLVDVINLLTGHLDELGGAMFTRAATGSPHTRGTPGKGKGVRLGRRRSRVREAPEVYGELPCACLAEEIETPGDGQIRALVTVAGNPVLSTPNGERLDRALDTLEFMVSLDIYVNETTRHADVILPGLSPLEQSHYDVILRQLAIRNVATYSPPTFDPPAGQLPEWQTVLRLAAIVAGQDGDADVAALDDLVVAPRVEHDLASPGSLIHGRAPAGILAHLAARLRPVRPLESLLLAGTY